MFRAAAHVRVDLGRRWGRPPRPLFFARNLHVFPAQPARRGLCRLQLRQRLYVGNRPSSRALATERGFALVRLESAASVRQWVCTLPWALRKQAGYKRAVCAETIEAFVASLTTELRQRAKRHLGLSSVSAAHTGLVTFVQRSDGALRLNVHLHTLALDGV